MLDQRSLWDDQPQPSAAADVQLTPSASQPEVQSDPPFYLMWFNDRTKPLEQIIADAANAYSARFGLTPNVTYINSELPIVEVEGIEVKVRKDIQKPILWIGCE